MSQSLAEVPQIENQSITLFEIPGCHFDQVSLTIEPGMEFQHWERLIRLLRRAAEGVQWYLGDALNYGEQEYGEKYAQVLDAHEKTGIPIDTLRNYQWVAGRVKPVTRVTTLGWAVHREVAPLTEDQQRKILQKGAAEKDAGKKYTQRQAEKDANKIKREGKVRPKDTAFVMSKEGRAFLDEYMQEGALWVERFPLGLSASERNAIEKMIYGHGNSALWLKNRTAKTDCAAIEELFSFEEGTPGIERANKAEISAWLEKCNYFVSDSDLDERLDWMVEDKRLEVKSVEDSRQDGRRGVMIDLYALHPDYEAQLDNAA